ncbi:MAG: tetratricopeptide repeat protein [Magnetococcales bacterium]|nr:tetratricopeptide repeat protein [Magnetococcales bacterium]
MSPDAVLLGQWLKEALLARQAGNLVAAHEACQRILRVDAGHADAHFILGLLAQAQNRHEEAVGLFQKALARSEEVVFLNNLAISLGLLKRDAEAEKALLRAIERAPDQAGSHYTLGNLHWRNKRPREAAAAFRRCLQLKPGHHLASNNLGAVLRELGELQEAKTLLRMATHLQPQWPEAWSNLGLVLQDLGLYQEAIQAFDQAIRLNPDEPRYLLNASQPLEALGRLTPCEALLNRALNLTESPGLQINLGLVLQKQGRHEEARNAFRNALTQDPHHAAAWSNWLLGSHYQPGIEAATLLARHREWAGQLRLPSPPAFANSREPDRALRIGLVSPDLGQHPVGYFMAAWMAHHRSPDYILHVYSDRARPDALTARLQQACQGWRETRFLTDAQLAETIRQDGIDILIDLAGHTAGNRLGCFALKPAPLQMSWAGYVGTTGLPTMDALLADATHVPPGEEECYGETVEYLPDGYICYQPPADLPEVSPSPWLEKGFFTYGCLQNPAKINFEVLSVWSEILSEVPGSRLWLQGISLEDVANRERIVGGLRRRGIAEERVVLRGALPHRQVLESYGEIDLVLDTFPYSGGLTTCEALVMGVPTLTWPGRSFAGRHASSHLRNAGFGEFVVGDVREYGQRAVALGQDGVRLAEGRGEMRLRVLASPLCDGERFVGNLYAVWRGLWQRRCRDV